MAVEIAGTPTVNVNAMDATNQTALIFACRIGLTRLVPVLISKRAVVNAVDTTHATALYHACDTRHVDIAQILLQAHADPKVGRNPQDCSIFNITFGEISKELDDLKLALFMAGAPPPTRVLEAVAGYKSKSPNKEAGVELLTEMGDRTIFRTGLNTATCLGHISRSADLNLKNEFDETAFDLACKHRNEDIGLAISLCVDVKKYKPETPMLYNSIFRSLWTLAAFLISKEADVNVKDDRTEATALYWACRYKNPTIALMLIDKGAKVDTEYTPPMGGPFFRMPDPPEPRTPLCACGEGGDMKDVREAIIKRLGKSSASCLLQGGNRRGHCRGHRTQKTRRHTKNRKIRKSRRQR